MFSLVGILIIKHTWNNATIKKIFHCVFAINTIENNTILVIHSIEAKAWLLSIDHPSGFSVSEAIPEFIKDLKIKGRALTSCFREKGTHCYRNWGCCIFSTGTGGFAGFSFLWPQVLLLPLPQLCQADARGSAVLGPPVSIFFQLTCFTKTLYNCGIGTIAKEHAMIQKFETSFYRCTTSVTIFDIFSAFLLEIVTALIYVFPQIFP